MLVIFAILGLLSLFLCVKLNSHLLLMPAALCMLAPIVPTFHLFVWQTIFQVGLICLCIISYSITVYLKNEGLKSKARLVKF